MKGRERVGEELATYIAKAIWDRFEIGDPWEALQNRGEVGAQSMN